MREEMRACMRHVASLTAPSRASQLIGLPMQTRLRSGAYAQCHGINEIDLLMMPLLVPLA